VIALLRLRLPERTVIEPLTALDFDDADVLRLFCVHTSPSTTQLFCKSRDPAARKTDPTVLIWLDPPLQVQSPLSIHTLELSPRVPGVRWNDALVPRPLAEKIAALALGEYNGVRLT